MRAHPSDRIGRKRRTRASRRRRRSSGFFRKLGRRLAFGLLILLVLSWAPVLALRWVDPPTTAFMLRDDSGRKPVRFEWTAREEIGLAAQLAVVASEDQKFASHFGFDLESIRDSIDDYGDGASLRGASTITQQVAKNLFLWPGKSFLRKGIEAYFTVLIELTWSKKRILEIYLNIAEFGPGVYGIRSASEVYFGKLPATLTDSEAALLAAVLPSPKRLHADRPSSYLRKRERWIIGQMQRLRREKWLTSLD